VGRILCRLLWKLYVATSSKFSQSPQLSLISYETLFTNEVMHPFVNEGTSYTYILTKVLDRGTPSRSANMTGSLSCIAACLTGVQTGKCGTIND
jgi:hypothetical protein